MSNARKYTTRRKKVVQALVGAFKTIDGTGEFQSDLSDNVFEKLRFWDEIADFPEVQINAGSETREYLTGGAKWRFLSITVRVYVHDEDDPEEELALVLEDLETVLEESGTIPYTDNDGVNQCVSDITIISISTDEGVLTPLGVGELVAELRY